MVINKPHQDLILVGFWWGMKLFPHYFNRPKRLENLDLLGFRNQIAYPYYLRVTIAQPVKCAVSRGLSL